MKFKPPELNGNQVAADKHERNALRIEPIAVRSYRRINDLLIKQVPRNAKGQWNAEKVMRHMNLIARAN